VPKSELLQTLRLVFLAISVKKITTATEIASTPYGSVSRRFAGKKKMQQKNAAKKFAGKKRRIHRIPADILCTAPIATPAVGIFSDQR